MKFSECYKQTGQLCRFSPNGAYLACTVQNRLIVRSMKSLEVLHIFSCQHYIQGIEWSADSTLILCAMFKRSLIQIWSMSQPSWCCKIDEGTGGIIAFTWSPDARHILTTAEFHVRITVWSLVNKAVSYIRYPKAVDQNHSFSSDGKYLALIERRECKDYVSIFSCSAWQLVKHFEVDAKDVIGIQWSPDSKSICLWESPLEYKILIYSKDGRCLSTYNAYNWALGIKAVSWSPSSQFLAIGSYDQNVRVLNHVIWRPVAEFQHDEILSKNDFIAYNEIEKPWGVRGLRLGTTSTKFDVVVDRPLQIPQVKPDLNKHNPRMGISYAEFSTNNRFLATINDNMPKAVWIWSMEDLCLSALMLLVNPVKQVSWSPGSPKLAVCTGNNKVYLWSSGNCTAVEMPHKSSFETISFRWHNNGECILAMSKEEMCLVYFG